MFRVTDEHSAENSRMGVTQIFAKIPGWEGVKAFWAKSQRGTPFCVLLHFY